MVEVSGVRLAMTRPQGEHYYVVPTHPRPSRLLPRRSSDYVLLVRTDGRGRVQGIGPASYGLVPARTPIGRAQFAMRGLNTTTSSSSTSRAGFWMLGPGW